MVTGKRAFDGKTKASVIGAILAAIIRSFTANPSERRVLTASILPPGKAAINELAISPDGKTLALAATAGGVILFSNRFEGIFRLSAQGGKPERVAAIDRTRQETVYLAPHFLPGGHRYVYEARNVETSAIVLAALDSNERTLLVAGASSPAFVRSAEGEEFLLFVRENTLMAQRFDDRLGTLAGDALSISGRVGESGILRRGRFSAASGALLVFGSESPGLVRLTWLDRNGKRLGEVGEPGEFFWMALSRDGRRLVYSEQHPQTR